MLAYPIPIKYNPALKPIINQSDTSENNHPPIWFNLTIVIHPSETIRKSYLTPKNLNPFDNLIWHQAIWIKNHMIIISITIWNHLIFSGVWWFSLSQQYISHPATLEQGNSCSCLEWLVIVEYIVEALFRGFNYQHRKAVFIESPHTEISKPTHPPNLLIALE